MPISDLTAVRPLIPQMEPGAFHRLHGEALREIFARVLQSGWYLLGEELAQFEAEFCRHFGFAHAIGVANGTDALVLALRALGIGAGDRVATVSHTAVATVAAIELAGAEPVLLDIDPAHYTLDPHSLVRALQTLPRIVAVIPVHLYGQPADLPAINEIAQLHGLRVIEDCAQAHGTRLQQRPVGLDADAATFSFYPTKNLGALGDAGLVAVASAQSAERVRRLREYGWQPRYVSIERGMNSRLDEVQAAVLRYRLPRLEEGNRRRAQIAAQYDRGLAGLPLGLPRSLAGATHSFHQYVVRHAHRDALQGRLRQAGVQTNVHYPVPVHLQPAYAQRLALDPAGLPVTEQLARECLSLPMYPELSDEQVAVVIDAVQRCA